MNAPPAQSVSASRYTATGPDAQPGGHTPRMPLSPPVTATHWNAAAQTICAKTRVSMAGYTPDSRTTNAPNSAAAKPATSGASSSPISTLAR